MAAFRSLLLLVALSFLPTFTRGDTDLFCAFMKSCILMCSFPPGDEVVIHWVQVPGDLPIHSYYHSQDQLTYQDARFKGRTALFKDQIRRGNASLLLSSVQLQDANRYRCYTSTLYGNKESYISLKAGAPVTKVHIEQVGDRLICSSEGIYPEPGLSWSTNPPSNTTFNSTTTVQQTEQQLYSISSSLTLPHGAADVDYSCTVSSSNSRTATSFKLTSISGSNTQTISCAASTTPLTSVTWRFNHSQVIVDNGQVSEKWRPYVEVTDSGSLILQLSSSDQDGIYTCEGNNAEETLITNTFLEYQQDSNTNTMIIVGVVVGFIIAAITAGIVCWKKTSNQTRDNKKQNTGNGNISNGEKDQEALMENPFQSDNQRETNTQ